MNLQPAYQYHDRTKHHLNQYARSLGFMDWANQPNPFRRFEGAPLHRVDFPAETLTPTFDELFSGNIDPGPLTVGSISRLFYFSLALSAWKQVRRSDGTVHNRWSLRVDPSSGNLHPTEGYLICGPLPGICENPAVYHYAPFEHGLELRRELRDWPLPPQAALIGLTSIHWREAWKYGERAFRYCQHDAGHAIGAIVISAAALGWSARLLGGPTSRELDELLGVAAQSGIEAEHADCLLALNLAEPPPDLSTLAGSEWMGAPNRLSENHHEWSVIDQVSAATKSPGCLPSGIVAPLSDGLLPERPLSAHQIIRQRRSAVAMDGKTALGREAFFRMLERVVPDAAPMPFAALGWTPAVSLALFVHRVPGLEAGLYVLVRHPSHESSLRESFRSDFLWERPDGCPERLPLYLLLPTDVRDAARTVSCHQDIAADGAFAAGMLAAFDRTLEAGGPATYPRLFWETGLIGQVLYLEAEAAGIRATGIGCFFDDAVHQLLGIGDHAWQSLYHFTVGSPVDDPRLDTVDAYAHLVARQQHGPDSWPES